MTAASCCTASRTCSRTDRPGAGWLPYGDSTEVDRAALVHAGQRPSQDYHAEIERAAADLLQLLQATGGIRSAPG